MTSDALIWLAWSTLAILLVPGSMAGLYAMYTEHELTLRASRSHAKSRRIQRQHQKAPRRYAPA